MFGIIFSAAFLLFGFVALIASLFMDLRKADLVQYATLLLLMGIGIGVLSIANNIDAYLEKQRKK